MNKSVKGPLYLLLCSIVWGTGFSAQSSAMAHIGPYTFVFLRSVITSLLLSAIIPLLTKHEMSSNARPVSNGRAVLIGSLCGFFLVSASILQQIGLVTTTTAKSGFITALYILIVPILGILLRKRPPFTVWIGVFVSLIGLYFLCLKEDGLNINIGDLFTLACALLFAVHIIVVDRFGTGIHPIKLNALQFGAAAVFSFFVMILFETPTIDGILACWKDVLFVAVFAGAMGYSLQLAGQKYTEPTLASLLMCLESVFAAIGGWIMLNQQLSGREILGCVLMLSASVVALLPVKRNKVNV